MYPEQFTTMGAMQLAKHHQTSPYEPKTDIINKIRDRKNRDAVKEMQNQHFAQPTSPRRRKNTAMDYPKKMSLKSKPGSNYVSPYSTKKLVQ